MQSLTLEEIQNLKQKEISFFLYSVYKINEQKRSKLKLITALNTLTTYPSFTENIFLFYKKTHNQKFKATAFSNVSKEIIDAFSDSYLEPESKLIEVFNQQILEIDCEKEKTLPSNLLEKIKCESIIAFPCADLGIFILAKKNKKSISETDRNFLKHFVDFILRPAVELAIDNERNFNSAIRDPLTNAYNRGYLDLYLEKEIKFAERKKFPVSVVMIDIDYFKNYNDLNGHQKGDKVLIDVVKTLMTNIRGYDIVARYGGEEFVIVLPHANLKSATKKAELIRQKIRDFVFFNEGMQPNGNLTISLGVATFPNNTLDSKELLHKADLALYKSKADGRDKTTAYAKKLEH